MAEAGPQGKTGRGAAEVQERKSVNKRTEGGQAEGCREKCCETLLMDAAAGVKRCHIIITCKDNLAATSLPSYCVRAKLAQLAVVIYKDLRVLLEGSTK